MFFIRRATIIEGELGGCVIDDQRRPVLLYGERLRQLAQKTL
jgi:hypothetical protein